MMSQQERRLVRLVWRGPGGGNYERLLSQGETRIGRANDNDICLFSDTKASRHHVIIVVQGTAVYVRDLTSLNGTFLNDTRLSIDPMAVRDRDLLVVGSTQFRVRLPNTGELERDLDFAAMSAAPDDRDDDLDAPMTLATDSGGLDLGPEAQGRIYQSGRITVIELGGGIEDPGGVAGDDGDRIRRRYRSRVRFPVASRVRRNRRQQTGRRISGFDAHDLD